MKADEAEADLRRQQQRHGHSEAEGGAADAAWPAMAAAMRAWPKTLGWPLSIMSRRQGSRSAPAIFSWPGSSLTSPAAIWASRRPKSCSRSIDGAATAAAAAMTMAGFQGGQPAGRAAPAAVACFLSSRSTKSGGREGYETLRTIRAAPRRSQPALTARRLSANSSGLTLRLRRGI